MQSICVLSSILIQILKIKYSSKSCLYLISKYCQYCKESQLVSKHVSISILPSARQLDIVRRVKVKLVLFQSLKRRSIRRFVITEKAPTRAFSQLKASTTAFTFETLLRHYAKQTLTPWQVDMKFGHRRNYHKGRAALRHYANQPARPL